MRVGIIAGSAHVAELVARALNIYPQGWAYIPDVDRARGIGNGAPVIVETDTFRHVRDGIEMLTYLNSHRAQVMRVSCDGLHGVIR